MIDTTIFKITQLSVSVATVLASAYVWVNRGLVDGLIFFGVGMVFTLVLRGVEQSIFADNIYHGRYSSSRY